MTYDFTRTGPQIQAIHDTVSDPSSNQAFTDSIGEIVTPKYTDIVYKASGGNSAVENMISGVPVEANLDDICSTGGTIWKRVSLSSPSVIDDFKNINSLNVTDFGAVGDGVTDDSPSFFAALSAGSSVFAPIPEVSYYFDSQCSIPSSNVLIQGSGRGCRITIKDGDTNGFNISGLSGVVIKGFDFSCKNLSGTLGGSSGKAAINLTNSSQCTVRDNSFFNMYNAGVRLVTSSNNTISNNYFGDWFSTSTPNDDASNILLLGSSSFNLITENFCIGEGAGSGVSITDYYIPNAAPLANSVTNNFISGKRAYGILIYTTDISQPDSYDTRMIVSSNTISTIYGDYISGNSGAGIYLQGAGGTVCSDNNVYDCCKLTTTFGTLAMAAIAANVTNEQNTAPILITNNRVHTFRGPGVWAASSSVRGIVVDNNTIRTEQVSSGDDSAIICSASSDSSICGNIVVHDGPGSSIYITTSGSNPERVKVNDNNVTTSNAIGTAINITTLTSGVFSHMSCSNNVIKSEYNGLWISNADTVSLVGNVVQSRNIAHRTSNADSITASNNHFSTTLAANYGVIISGSGSTYDKSNVFDLNTSKMQRLGTGSNLEQYTSGTVPEIYGTYQLGDRYIARSPAVGDNIAYRCTTAGEPGTWTPEGVL